MNGNMFGKSLIILSIVGGFYAFVYEFGTYRQIYDAAKMYGILEQTQNIAQKIQLPVAYNIVKGEENQGHGHYVWYRFTLDINSTECTVVIFNVIETAQVFTAVEEDTCGIKV